jgi:hypothetical protein
VLVIAIDHGFWSACGSAGIPLFTIIEVRDIVEQFAVLALGHVVEEGRDDTTCCIIEEESARMSATVGARYRKKFGNVDGQEIANTRRHVATRRPESLIKRTNKELKFR